MKTLSRNQWLGFFILSCLILMAALNLVVRQPAQAQIPDETSHPSRIDEEADRRQAIMAEKAAQMQASYRSLAPETFTPCVNGFAGSYACEEVDLMAFMPLTTFSAGSANDVQGWTDPLDGKEYAVLGLNNGTAFIDITDPENPVYLGKLPGHNNSSSLWREMEVMGNYVYVVSEAGGHGLQIFDLTELRNVTNPPVTFAETEHYNAFGNGHTVGGNPATNFMYAMGTNTCSGGLHMVNVADPLNPLNAGCYSADGYSHDAQCILYNGPDVPYQGHEICFNSNEDTLTIVDVTNKASPVTISINPYAGSAYTHQTWITDDHTYLLLQDELDEGNFGHNSRTRIWDVSDLNAPEIIGIHDGPYPAIDHNAYIYNGYAYLANYTAGLQIFDLETVANGTLTRKAFFDSYLPDDSATFEGAWAVYPFFESGLVLITGIGEGMYIVKPTLDPAFTLETEASNLTVCTPGQASALFDLAPQNGYTQTVTMSADNLPIGAVANFAPNPVAVPGTSTMTVTVSTTPAGTYPFSVIGTDTVLTETVDLSLLVYDTLPGPITLTSPADGAVNVPVPVTFSWTAGTQAVTYDLEIATDPAFTNIVYTAQVAGTSHIAEYGFAEVTTYYWRVRSANPCGTGPYSNGFSFTTEQIPPILVVDDDDNAPNVRNYYTQALDELGQAYDIWNTNNTDNEPTLADLAPYEIVIWFTGDEFGGAAGPATGGEAALAAWLEGYNGCFFLSSQDYYYDRGLTSFMEDYLGVASLSEGGGNYSYANGQGIFADLGSRVLLYPFTDQADTVVPDASANLGIVGNNGNGAALTKDSGTYKTTFWAFPLEAIYGNQHRRTALNLFLSWCAGDTPTPTPTPTLTPTVTPTATPPPGQDHPLYLPLIQR
ncbi:MAG: hypothetical protein Fur0022_47550 [Anaerolineales bacterium]